MTENEKKAVISSAKTALGIEFGSTNIKAVLTALDGTVLSTGNYGWENRLEDGIWTYHLDDIWAGLAGCYGDLKDNVKQKYSLSLTKIGCIGISAMMHGYLAFDKEMKLLHPFETWRNTDTQAAADELTELFDFNIPQRWSIAHLYQRMLDGESHVTKIDRVFTLDAYVHFALTGEFVTGVGDASGMFPQKFGDYDQEMVDKFDALAGKKYKGFSLRKVFPKVLLAGQDAGSLTKEGALLLDPSGDLEAGIPFAPPEGDAGTGMVATNAIRKYTGNTSAGTSTFAMLVLDKPLSKPYRELDMVTTPTGYSVAMAHANNGTTDINKWMDLFAGVIALYNGAPVVECSEKGRKSALAAEDSERGRKSASAAGSSEAGRKSASADDIDMGRLFTALFKASTSGAADCGGLVTYGYYSGEGITGLNEGRPLMVKSPDSDMSVQNFVRSLVYGSLASVKIGMDILLKDEGARCDAMTGHGGLFKTQGVAQQYLADALGAPVRVMETASEGGPWGMALLAAYRLDSGEKSLEDWLDGIFKNMNSTVCPPTKEGAAGFASYISHYKDALAVERTAVDVVKW